MEKQKKRHPQNTQASHELAEFRYYNFTTENEEMTEIMDGMKLILLAIYKEYNKIGDASLCGVAIIINLLYYFNFY